MSNEKMFETAVRNKVRFPFKGVVSVEDLWDLSVESLDTIYKSLNSQLKQAKEESLLSKKTRKDEELDLQIEIVRYIVSVKLEEDAARVKIREQNEKKQKIMEILSSKQDAELEGKSVDELQKMLNDLSN